MVIPLRPMDGQRAAWDLEYSKPDPVWKGPPQEGADLPAGLRVLEVGCGNGKTLAALARAGNSVVGVDFSTPALRTCPQGERIELVRGNVLRMPMASRSFDVAVLFHVLEHFLEGDRARVVEEVRRVLRPGGHALVRVFSTSDMRYGKGTEVEKDTFVRGTGIRYHYFREEELHELFQGFRTVTLTEVRSNKRYGNEERIRSELVGAFRLPG